MSSEQQLKNMLKESVEIIKGLEDDKEKLELRIKTLLDDVGEARREVAFAKEARDNALKQVTLRKRVFDSKTPVPLLKRKKLSVGQWNSDKKQWET